MKYIFFYVVFFTTSLAFSAQKSKASVPDNSLKIALMPQKNDFSTEKKMTWKEKFVLKKINKKVGKVRHGGVGGGLGEFILFVAVLLLLLTIGAIIALLTKTFWLAILLGALALFIFGGTLFLFS